jgi:DNA repair protein RadA/Sms
VRPVALADVRAERVARLQTGIGELDRVLGGGLVPGSLVLLGGSPGIGKSTLTGHGARQPRRAGRASCTSRARSPPRRSACAPSGWAAALRVPVIAETDLDVVLATLEAEQPGAVIIDSVQTLHAPELSARRARSGRSARSPTASRGSPRRAASRSCSWAT